MGRKCDQLVIHSIQKKSIPFKAFRTKGIASSKTLGLQGRSKKAGMVGAERKD